MHIFLSGIGGTAIGPLAMIAGQAGYSVSGSDKRDSQYIQYLRTHNVNNIHIGQTYDQIAEIHAKQPIDWYVYSSAVAIENPDAPELRFCAENKIKVSKRDDLLNHIITDKKMKLIAIAGTHGKTTTTAMTIWLFKQLGVPVSYSVGAKISFGEMGQYSESSEYFIYEADEFDRNFLSFRPHLSLITGVGWDHHEQYPTIEDYQQAFSEFMKQSRQNIVWMSDAERLALPTADDMLVLEDSDLGMLEVSLIGQVNRRDAWQAIHAVHVLTNHPKEKLLSLIGSFPGLNRRFERLQDGLYSDYAHTTEKIRGCLQTAQEHSENVVVVYEPLTDRRQHFIKNDYRELFRGVKKLYWVPSYLAREDPDQPVLSPASLIEVMQNKHIAEPAVLDEKLKQSIKDHLNAGDLVVCLSGGGGGSLDEWLRANFVRSGEQNVVSG